MIVNTVFKSNFQTAPYLGYIDEINTYFLVLNPKRDHRKIKKIMKCAKEKIRNEQFLIKNIKPNVVFSVTSYEKYVESV